MASGCRLSYLPDPLWNSSVSQKKPKKAHNHMLKMKSKNIGWKCDYKLHVCQADLHPVIYFLIIPCRFREHLWAAILIHCTDSQEDSSLGFWLEILWTSTFLIWSHPVLVLLYSYCQNQHSNHKFFYIKNSLQQLPLQSLLSSQISVCCHWKAPPSDSSTCTHHSMALDEWWAVPCQGSVRHNTGWRSIFLSTDHIFCVTVSEL